MYVIKIKYNIVVKNMVEVLSVELINSVQQSLAHDGVLDSLRSQLRAHVFGALKKSNNQNIYHHPSPLSATLDASSSKLNFPPKNVTIERWLA